MELCLVLAGVVLIVYKWENRSKIYSYINFKVLFFHTLMTAIYTEYYWIYFHYSTDTIIKYDIQSGINWHVARAVAKDAFPGGHTTRISTLILKKKNGVYNRHY